MECLLLLNVEGIEHHSTFLTIFMVFDYKEIYYYFCTSKYKQILTNKSHRHEILKSSHIQRIAVCTYTQEIVFFYQLVWHVYNKSFTSFIFIYWYFFIYWAAILLVLKHKREWAINQVWFQWSRDHLAHIRSTGP